MTNTPSVEGDRLTCEHGGLRKVKGTDLWECMSCGSRDYKPGHSEAALPCKGGEGIAERALSNAALYCEARARVILLESHLRKGVEALRMDEDELPFHLDGSWLDEADALLTAPSTEPDTGRDAVIADLQTLQKTFKPGVIGHQIISRALAALSDTPRGREEEGKQGLMASRDLGPTTVASSLKGSDVGEVKP